MSIYNHTICRVILFCSNAYAQGHHKKKASENERDGHGWHGYEQHGNG